MTTKSGNCPTLRSVITIVCMGVLLKVVGSGRFVLPIHQLLATSSHPVSEQRFGGHKMLESVYFDASKASFPQPKTQLSYNVRTNLPKTSKVRRLFFLTVFIEIKKIGHDFLITQHLKFEKRLQMKPAQRRSTRNWPRSLTVPKIGHQQTIKNVVSCMRSETTLNYIVLHAHTVSHFESTK